MPNLNAKRSTLDAQRGFTLVEVLVTVAIISLLSAIGLQSFQAAQGRARDSKRKSDLRDLQKAIQLYYQDNKSYPVTSTTSVVWYGSEPGNLYSDNGGNWIPGLVSGGYIPQLPRDPKGGFSTNPWGNCTGLKRSYLYYSNGIDYKLLSYCAPEGTLDPLDAFYDPTRGPSTWQISTDAARNW